MSSLALKELRNKPDVPHLNVLVELIDVLMFTAGAVEHLKPVAKRAIEKCAPCVFTRMRTYLDTHPVMYKHAHYYTHAGPLRNRARLCQKTYSKSYSVAN